jgi:hypothetical protein
LKIKIQQFTQIFCICGVLFLLPLISVSQIHSDCISALPLEKGVTIEMDMDTLIVGEDKDQIIHSECYSTDFDKQYGLWYQFTILREGDLVFDIIPVKQVDIDFVLYRSVEGSCGNLEMVRCMTSGESIGAPWSSNKPCIGPTGLRYSSEDFIEHPGCNEGSDNYLAPMMVEESSVFYLKVIDYSHQNKNINYLIRPGGTAEF